LKKHETSDEGNIIKIGDIIDPEIEEEIVNDHNQHEAVVNSQHHILKRCCFRQGHRGEKNEGKVHGAGGDTAQVTGKDLVRL